MIPSAAVASVAAVMALSLVCGVSAGEELLITYPTYPEKDFSEHRENRSLLKWGFFRNDAAQFVSLHSLKYLTLMPNVFKYLQGHVCSCITQDALHLVLVLDSLSRPE